MFLFLQFPNLLRKQFFQFLLFAITFYCRCSDDIGRFNFNGAQNRRQNHLLWFKKYLLWKPWISPLWYDYMLNLFHFKFNVFIRNESTESLIQSCKPVNIFWMRKLNRSRSKYVFLKRVSFTTLAYNFQNWSKFLELSCLWH